MSETIQSFDVALTERERFTLAVFFSNTYKPKSKAERKAMKLAFRRLNLDEIVARMRKPGGVNPAMLLDTPTVIPLNQETVNWVIANLNTVQSDTADSLILGDVEDYLDAVQAGTYTLPPNAVKPKAALMSVTTEAPSA